MPLKKIISPGTEKYLPIAKKKLAAMLVRMKKYKWKFRVETIVVDTGITIQLQSFGDFSMIWIAGAVRTVAGYLFGGSSSIRENTFLTKDTKEYSTSDVWVDKTDMPAKSRRYHAAASLNSSAYIFSGIGNDGFHILDNDRYEPTSDTWTNKADMPILPIYVLTATAIESSGYVFSSYNDEYEPNLDTWTNKADMPYAVQFSAASTIGTSGYVYGGGPPIDNNYKSNTEEYTPSLNAWTSKTDMPGPGRMYASSVSIGFSGYLFGGSAANWERRFLADTDEYTPLLDTWTNKTDIPGHPTIYLGRYLMSAFALESEGYITGGWQGSDLSNGGFWNILDSTTAYAPSSDTWSDKANLVSPKTFAAGTAA